MCKAEYMIMIVEAYLRQIFEASGSCLREEKVV